MYKPIKGFSNYAVDENGVVYSYFYNRPLEGRSNKGGYRQKELAVMYNVSRPTITRLINGTTWSNFKCAA